MLTVVAQQDGSWGNALLLSKRYDWCGLEHGASCASQWTVCGNQDTLLLADINDFLLRKRWVVLNLVDSWDDSCDCEELLQIFLAVVGDTNGLYFAAGKELLHFQPGLGVIPLRSWCDITGTIWLGGEFNIVSCKYVR